MPKWAWLVVGIGVGASAHAATMWPTVGSMDDTPWRVASSGQAKVQALARGQNAFVGRMMLEPGAKVAPHADTTEEFVVVLSGGGTMVLGGETHRLTKGSVVYMPAGIQVSYTNGDEASEILQVFAGPEPASKYDAWPVAP